MIMRSTAFLGASLLVVLATACGDDGGNNNGSCGDGHVTGSEQCDDGNTTNGDGCSASCQTESGGGVCGDSTVDVNKGETCDDGNTASGDGCSSSCQVETPAGCGNGTVAAPEGCDDGNTAAGDGCSATCTVENGYTCTGMPSVCTMGQPVTGTCTAPINLTLTGTGDLTATLTGDTTTGTSQVGDAACDGFGPEGGAHDKIFKFTTTDVRDLVIEIDSTVTMHGAIIRLMTAPCDLTTEIPEYTGAEDGCADIEGAGFLGYVNRPAGTYYIVVDGYQAGEDGPFQVNLKAKLPGCGNGMADPQLDFCDDGNTMNGDGCNSNCEVEMGWNCRTTSATMPSVCQMIGCGDGLIQTGEDCDDDNTTPGDGCDATCKVESGWLCDTAMPTVCVMAGCGNGIVEDATEECDDGNMTSGDRCSSTCQLESDVAEAAEPNDTVPQVLTAGSHIIRGEWMTGDVDLYTFTLATPMKVEIETYFTINGVTTDYDGVGNNKFDCTTTDDTMLGVFAAGVDVTMDTLAMARDSDDGDSYCAYIGANDSDDDDYEPMATPTDTTQLAMLPAGTYTIKLSGDTLPGSTMVTMPRRYLLDLKISPVGGTPVPPAAGDIVINEFVADDGPNANGDTNCDGIVTGTNDEFIEFVNVSNKTLDLTGLTIKDGGNPTATPPVPPQLEFTFGAATNVGPGSLTLAPGKAVVVWAGGAPACPGVTNWFTPVLTQGTLSLNNAGDTITLATGDATPVTIATTTYATATQAVSFNLNPDAMAGSTYALHTALTGAVGSYSPGKHADGTAF